VAAVGGAVRFFQLRDLAFDEGLRRLIFVPVIQIVPLPPVDSVTLVL
jgi:hypothetical protein